MSEQIIAVLGVDLGKNSVSLAGLDAAGSVVVRKRTTRDGAIKFTAKLPSCVVAMEACCGAHFVARIMARQGHTIRLMSPEYVKPYVKAQKTDDRDAEAIAEAATRPTMRFVTQKTEAQLDLQTLHRVRERMVTARTALTNQLRAILLERGLIFPKGRQTLMRRLDQQPAELNELGTRMQQLVADIRAESAELDKRIEALNDELAEVARRDESARRLATIPGVGVINATALVAAIGDGSAFAKGRDLSAWLGLVPRQHSTGGKTKMLGISKRGNQYLRRQLIHGARSVLLRLKETQTPMGIWLSSLLGSVHRNVAVVALASKLARIAWALLRHRTDFDRRAFAGA
jgi:transposase